MMIAAGAPPVLCALALAFNTNLFGAITPFCSGQAAVYSGAGFIRQGDFLKLGAIFSGVNLLLWFTFGFLWWHALGLW